MSTIKHFKDLGLPNKLLEVLAELGYESPTPIQAQSVPVLMNGDDILAQAQTGTGKTASFALPILADIDLSNKEPQALVIAPTRELAIQVAEAFQSYAKQMKGFHVAPIYGGQDYPTQLRALKRGAHVIVGTPGRLMDHLRRGTLSTDSLKTLVLDEADEMLKMGFIDDVEWILEQIPNQHQTALFSATMPSSIKHIADRYLKDAKKIHIAPKESTVTAIDQAFIRVTNKQKLEVLTRLLEVEDVAAAIIFTRTKNTSSELAEKLQARGYAASALNGDMNQAARKKVIDRIKNESLDIIVATDVAARGIDVPRVSHVINYDIPCDTESYVHRIGRTGRAGRKGKALLFVAPREQRLLGDIERTILKEIRQIEAPTLKEMKERRYTQLAAQVIEVLEEDNKYKAYRQMVENIKEQGDYSEKDIAAAIGFLMQQSNPLPTFEIESPEPERRRDKRASKGKPRSRNHDGRRKPSDTRDKPRRAKGKPFKNKDSKRKETGGRKKSSGEFKLKARKRKAR